MHGKIVRAALVCLLLTAATALAQGGPRRGEIVREFANARITARLNLTPEQVKQIQEIAKAHRAARPGQRPAAQANMAMERQALLQAIFTDKPNQGEIQKHMDALAQQQTVAAQQRQQRMTQYVDTMLEINQVLTPAQRAEFQKMLEENARTRQIRRGQMRQRMLNRDGQPQNTPPKVN